MSSFSPPTTYNDGDTMTAAQFMAQFTNMIPLSGFITERTNLLSADDTDLILIQDVSSGVLSYCTRAVLIASAAAATGALKQTISQTSHGFGVGQALYESSTAGVYALASATSAALSDGFVGVIESVPSVDSFVMITHGLLNAQSSLTAGTAYYLSDATPGSLTSVAPSTAIRVYTAISTTSAIININRSGGASSNTAVIFQGRLSLSTTNLLLSPYDGNQIFINGTQRTLSSTGVPLSPAGLAAGTNYNIYAYWTGSAIALTASTTARATDATYGHQVCNGDSLKVLVAKARTNSSTAWADSSTARYLMNYYYRKPIEATHSGQLAPTTASTTYVELDNTKRVEFLSWGDEAIYAAVNGSCYNNTATSYCRTSMGFDGITAEDTYSEVQQPANSANYRCNLAVSINKSGLSEGYHYVTLLGSVDANAGAWYSAADSAGLRTKLRVFTRG